MSLAALVLCAGRSRRMGIPKGWLVRDGVPLLEGVLRACGAAGADPIVVVSGPPDDPGVVSRSAVERYVAERPQLRAMGERLRYGVGMPDGQPIDSIRAGLNTLSTLAPLLLWPIDTPFADAALVRRLVDALAGRPDFIAAPQRGGRLGHPVLFGSAVVEELRSPLADAGAHSVVRKDPRRIAAVPCSDTRIFAPLNTPEDARALGIVLP